MTAAEREWEPGDPLMPDNGCGPMTGVNLTAEERDAVIAEGGYRPQWWRPGPEPGGLASTRYCLAAAGREYVVYQPKRGAAFTVELPAGKYRVEWFDAAAGIRFIL